MTRKYWTNHEEAEIRNRYGVDHVSEIAADLNRTEQAIYKKAQKLGLFSEANTKFKPKHCRTTIAAMIASNNTSREIAAELGLRPQHVTEIAKNNLSRALHKKLQATNEMATSALNGGPWYEQYIKGVAPCQNV